MSIDPAILRVMHANGATTEMIIAVVEAAAVLDEARLERKRANNAERQRRFRAAHSEDDNAGNALPDVTAVTGVTEPLSLSPNENNSNPHTHTPEEKPRTRKAGFVLPDHIPDDEWNGYVEMRRRIGKPMTDYAKRLAIAELDKLAADGWPPGPVLNQSTMNSYQGLFVPKDQGKRNGNRPANDRSSGNLLERLRADDAASGLA